MNQSAIDRGFFRSVFFRTYNDRASHTEKITKPDTLNTKGLKRATYDKLDIDGLIRPGTQVIGDDIIIGKISQPKNDEYENGQRVTKTKMASDAS